MNMDRNPLAEGYEARSKKANALFYVGGSSPHARGALLDIRFHSFSDGEVIG